MAALGPRERALELAQHVLLLAAEMDRRLDDDPAQEIPDAVPAHRLDPLALHAKQPAGLGLGRDLEHEPPIECRHVQLAAQGRGDVAMRLQKNLETQRTRRKQDQENTERSESLFVAIALSVFSVVSVFPGLGPEGRKHTTR